MSEEKKATNEETPTANSMAAFSDKLNDLGEALGLLYIIKNSSGRNKFREKWPEISEYLFGSTLINYDINGCDDKEQRAKLEEEANERRIMLKTTISEIVDKSVESGSLMFDYVGEVLDKYGADISVFLYAEDVIERVRPGLLATRKEISDKQETASDSDKALKVQTPETSSKADITNNNDDVNETTPIEEEQILKPDEKLSSEEKSLLSNNADTKEKGKENNIEPAITSEKAPAVAHNIDIEQNNLNIEKTEAPSDIKENPEQKQDIQNIEVEIPEEVQPIQTPPPPQVDIKDASITKSETGTTPNISQPPLEPASEEEKPTATKQSFEEQKITEKLTAQQAAKANKGVYTAVFNAIAKAV